MKKALRFRVAASVVFLLYVTTGIAAQAQTFTSLASFDLTNGAGPYLGSPLQGFDGNFYGTTSGGGARQSGTVFKVRPTGTLTNLHSFSPDSFPLAGVVQAADGNFYGTTSQGGSDGGCFLGCGTVFKISHGALTTLYSFCTQFECSDGAYPSAGLIQATDGNFYGTTQGGGIGGANGYGTVFKITSSGTLTTLYAFCFTGNCTDGRYPLAGLIQATDGNFYGTTYGGSIGPGTVFKITPGGALTTLHTFNGTDGGEPFAGLVQATDGSFYGTTQSGGANNYGTVFKITSEGSFTGLYSFCAVGNCIDGYSPSAALLQATDGSFYGTTSSGGANGSGTVFEITPEGALTTLHSFDGADGAAPASGLVQGTNGSFYGTTQFGGSSDNCVLGCGTVFSLSVGLAPFVETLPTVGKVASKVIILGNGLTGTTSVTFNGTAASFTVVSPTEIEATVPTGATNGKVQVTTPHGTLTSNVVFRVK